MFSCSAYLCVCDLYQGLTEAPQADLNPQTICAERCNDIIIETRSGSVTISVRRDIYVSFDDDEANELYDDGIFLFDSNAHFVVYIP